MRNTLLAATAIVALAGFASARPAVTNGGFETGDFTGWAQFGSGFLDGVSPGPPVTHSGDYGAYFGEPGSLGGISQTITASIGDIVTVSFWLACDGGTPNAFECNFDGSTIMSFTDSAAFEYTLYSFSGILVTNNNPTLSFGFRDDPGFMFLDDVDVRGNVVPLPTAAGLGLAGLTLVGLRRRR